MLGAFIDTSVQIPGLCVLHTGLIAIAMTHTGSISMICNDTFVSKQPGADVLLAIYTNNRVIIPSSDQLCMCSVLGYQIGAVS